MCSTGFALMNGTNPKQKFDCMGNRKADFSELSTCQCKYGFFICLPDAPIYTEKTSLRKSKNFSGKIAQNEIFCLLHNYMPLQYFEIRIFLAQKCSRKLFFCKKMGSIMCMLFSFCKEVYFSFSKIKGKTLKKLGPASPI